MSVEYSTRVGYGYIISANEITSEDFEKQLNESDYIFPIDSWSTHPNYFFGILHTIVKEGTGYMIPVRRPVLDQDKLYEMIDEYKTFFPNKDNYICHDYVLACVD